MLTGNSFLRDEELFNLPNLEQSLKIILQCLSFNFNISYFEFDQDVDPNDF